MAILTTYNDSPPSDDGSEVDSNKITWAKIKDELTDPLKNWIDAPDLDANELILDADGDTSITADIDDQVDIRVGGSDVMVINAARLTHTGTLEPQGDTAAGDNAAIGYTAAEGLILTGQGSTNDVTVKNDADAEVLSVRTGTTNVDIEGTLFLKEVADSSADVAGYGQIFAKTSNDLWFKDGAGAGYLLHSILSTEQTTTGATAYDFTSIPSDIHRIVIMVVASSTNGTDDWLVQVGDSGGIETSGYVSSCFNESGAVGTNSTAGFLCLADVAAASSFTGKIILDLEDSTNNTWVSQSTLIRNGAAKGDVGAGHKSLSATLDRIRLTTTGGTDTWDSISINISFE